MGLLTSPKVPQMVLYYLAGAVSGFLLGFIGNNYTSNITASTRHAPYNAVLLGKPQSHKDVYTADDLFVRSGAKPTNFSIDMNKHEDNDSVARYLYDKVRILVWVMTHPDNLEKKARHVNNTWGKRANKIYFASDYYDSEFPTMNITVEHGRAHLTAKTMAAYDYVYKHHLNDYDWFMKADDDTYVIMENLRYFLSSENPNQPFFFGHWFKTKTPQGYYSGGGGYVISKEALRLFGERPKDACSNDLGAEDVAFGRCMHALGVKTKASLDSLGRSRFHCFNPPRFLRGRFPQWYLVYDKYNATHQGTDSMSDYAITFHYISIEAMYDLEYYIYHLRPYGILSGLQELNN